VEIGLGGMRQRAKEFGGDLRLSDAQPGDAYRGNDSDKAVDIPEPSRSSLAADVKLQR
jgi:hypothetical protein